MHSERKLNYKLGNYMCEQYQEEISIKIIPSATHQQETKMIKNSDRNIYSISLAT